jgi:hypothetical protein
MFNSCDLVDKYGCTTASAINYDGKATRPDNSCVYAASGILFWDTQTRNYLTLANVTTIDLVLDGEKLLDNADILTFDYVNYPQSCFGGTWPTFDTRITSNYSSPVHVKMFNQSDSLVISDVLYMNEGCDWYQIEHF